MNVVQSIAFQLRGEAQSLPPKAAARLGVRSGDTPNRGGTLGPRSLRIFSSMSGYVVHGPSQVFAGARVSWSMHTAYAVITILAALACSYAACLNFVSAQSVKVVADKVQISQKWMIPFGTLLAAGAAGLLVGLVVPVLGIAAAIGLIVYFICALGAHIRVRDTGFAGAVSFLVLAVAALIASIGYHNHL